MQFLAILLVVFGAFMRLVPHVPNIAPISAIALFAGVYLNRRMAFTLPIAAMLVSDFFIGFDRIAMRIAVYGSFALSGVIGLWVRRNKNAQTVIAGSLAASTQFYLVTNFAVWLFGAMYPKTFAGLMMSYGNAVPFFRYTLLGDLLFVGVLFGVYELAHALAMRRKAAYELVRL